jgi:hypothetical protein
LKTSARGLSTKSANRQLGRPGGVGLCDKAEQVVGFPIAIGSGALFGYFLGKQKVKQITKDTKTCKTIFQLN